MKFTYTNQIYPECLDTIFWLTDPFVKRGNQIVDHASVIFQQFLREFLNYGDFNFSNSFFDTSTKTDTSCNYVFNRFLLKDIVHFPVNLILKVSFLPGNGFLILTEVTFDESELISSQF